MGHRPGLLRRDIILWSKIEDKVDKMNESFRRRYIRRNAEVAQAMELRDATRKKEAGLTKLLTRKKEILQGHEEAEFAAFAVAREESARGGSGKLNIPQLQFFITDACTLNCRDCNVFIPAIRKMGKKPYFLDPDDFKKDIYAIESVANTVRNFILIGGEPLAHPRIGELIRIALKSPVVDTVEIITNGTLLPNDEARKALEEFADKIYVRASDYNAVSDVNDKLKGESLAGLCQDLGVKFLKIYTPWVEIGDFSLRNPRQQASELFRICRFRCCNQVYDGKIFVCPKANGGFILGDANAHEYVDIRDKNRLFERLVDFYSKECFDMCLTCPDHKQINMAEQLA